jgi:hypothetical protein
MNEQDQISQTIDAYLKAIKTGDPKHFKRAFYTDAVVINAGESDIEKSVIPIADFAHGVKKRHDDGVDVEEIPLGITISQAANVGNVRVDFELRIGETKLFGTDFFNVVKRSGEWRISQKIYDVTHTS